MRDEDHRTAPPRDRVVRRSSQRDTRSSQRDAKAEFSIYGHNACLAQFQLDPASVIRLYLRQDRLETLAPIVQYCTQNRLVYRLIDDEQLARVSGAIHHEGVCLVVKQPKNPSADELLRSADGAVLVLDGVQNPHNLGALFRSAAHFGCCAVLLCGVDRVSGATHRVAQGGVQAVPVSCTERSAALASLARHDFTLFACSASGGTALGTRPFPRRAAFVLGNEREGLSPEWLASGAHRLTIGGTGAVESLNVSVAGAVVLAEHFRQFARNANE